MKLECRLLFIVCLLFINGCSVQPEAIGISQQQWKKMSDSQRQQALVNFKQLNSIDNKSEIVNKNNWLIVNFKGGTVLMPPFDKRSYYEPFAVKIYQGEFKSVYVYKPDYSNRVRLYTCYKNNVLLIDPSFYDTDKAQASIRLYKSPLWVNGFTYNNLNSSGYAALQNVAISISEFAYGSDVSKK